MSTQTFNIALPSDLLLKVDQRAKKEYRNRSELIREALRIYLEDKAEWEQIYVLGEKAMQTMRITSEEDITKKMYEYRHKKN